MLSRVRDEEAREVAAGDAQQGEGRVHAEGQGDLPAGQCVADALGRLGDCRGLAFSARPGYGHERQERDARGRSGDVDEHDRPEVSKGEENPCGGRCGELHGGLHGSVNTVVAGQRVVGDDVWYHCSDCGGLDS